MLLFIDPAIVLSMFMLLFNFSDSMWKQICAGFSLYVNIGDIGDYHCLNILFMINEI